MADLGSLISHSISGKEIQEIYFDENTLIDTERIPLASFKSFKKTETLQLITDPNPESDNHSCICVMYEPRKVHKFNVRFHSFQGRRRTDGRPTNFLPKGMSRRWDDRLLWTLQSTTLIALLILLFIILIVGMILILRKLKSLPKNAIFNTSLNKTESQL